MVLPRKSAKISEKERWLFAFHALLCGGVLPVITTTKRPCGPDHAQARPSMARQRLECVRFIAAFSRRSETGCPADWTVDAQKKRR
ncbi:MAG: hypothetical protein HY735_13480 [Verrucomicrobia bacterium]|nr:hypothetical protein [Verrucomicrobiota bacterium]